MAEQGVPAILLYCRSHVKRQFAVALRRCSTHRGYGCISPSHRGKKVLATIFALCPRVTLL
jgi:hypothetical protein